MDTPLISILLPTFNGSRYIREAIDSVLFQDYPSFELIIIDDASTDDTPKILEEYSEKDQRIRVIRNQTNLKLVASLNRGLDEAEGEYIARIDDDDMWIDPKKLSKQIDVMEKDISLGVVGTFAQIIDERGQKTGKNISYDLNKTQVRVGFGLKNELIHTSILARRNVIREAGGYNKKWLYVEDFDLWLRILAQGYEIENIPQECVLYRIREGSTTGKKYHRMQWLTFLRLYHEKHIYQSRWRRFVCLFIRLMLVIIPAGLIRFVK